MGATKNKTPGNRGDLNFVICNKGKDYDSMTKDDSGCFCEELKTCVQKALVVFGDRALDKAEALQFDETM